MEEERTDRLKTSINYLSNLILEYSGVYREYSDEDLANATLIFEEVFMARMYKNNIDRLNKEQRIKLAEEAGKSIRQTILLFTGVDMHIVFTDCEECKKITSGYCGEHMPNK